jgi:hypothetical protein
MNPKKKRTVNRNLLDSYHLKPCVVCSKTPSDPHHITSRGAGGGDIEENLISLCRQHHTQIHQEGQTKFLIRYPHVRFKLTKGDD